MIEEDPEGWKKARRKSKSSDAGKESHRKSEAKYMSSDAGKENHRQRQAKYMYSDAGKENHRKRQAKYMSSDAEKENHRKRQAKYIEKEREQHPEKVKARQKKTDDARNDNGEKKHRRECQFGPTFPCACCHTMKFRHQVVMLTKEQAAKIDQKAREAHEALQVICIINPYYLV